VRRMKVQAISKIACKRQVAKNADTFIIIYALPRTGKTTLAFWILFYYLLLKRKLYELGKSKWNPENSWKELFVKYFAGSSSEMGEKLKSNPEESFVFVDEGLDVVSWHSRLTNEQKDLLELIQKTGKRKDLILLVTPSLRLLTSEILARAHYMFIIPNEPDKDNIAFLFKNYTVPFLAERHPFGLDEIEKGLEKHPVIAMEPTLFVKYLVSKQRLIGVVKFKEIDQTLYNLYDKLIKEPSIMREKKRGKKVSARKYAKVVYRLGTVLHNLVKKEGRNAHQLSETLLVDKFGTKLLTSNWTRKLIADIEEIEDESQVYSLYDEEAKQEIQKAEEIADISLDETLNPLTI